MDKQNKDNRDTHLEEQHAPLKNTDHAFVQVGKDGEPVMPQREDAKDDQQKDDLRDSERGTTIKHR